MKRWRCCSPPLRFILQRQIQRQIQCFTGLVRQFNFQNWEFDSRFANHFLRFSSFLSWRDLWQCIKFGGRLYYFSFVSFSFYVSRASCLLAYNLSWCCVCFFIRYSLAVAFFIYRLFARNPIMPYNNWARQSTMPCLSWLCKFAVIRWGSKSAPSLMQHQWRLWTQKRGTNRARKNRAECLFCHRHCGGSH